MSLKVCAICDGCGEVMGGGKNGAAARADAREKGASTSLPGGRDLCRECGDRERGSG
jgi:glycerol-3-phosphate dehydrogenase